MREDPAPAIEPGGLGYRRPERRRNMIPLNRRAERTHHPNAVRTYDFFMQGLMVAPNTGGRCAGVREPFPKATESQTIS